MATSESYPVHLDASLDQSLSRWLWLVKWFLAIPHFIVLAFLWAAFALLSIVAFFAILFTGRYPRPIFEFNVGVLRWTWRVAFYAWGTLGTDRYPPFTLAEVADYPAHLDVDYTERLSRGLVLVKWWLLAIPQYVVVGILLGGAGAAAGHEPWRAGGIGLISVLVVVAAVTLLFTGSYPLALFDLVLGLNRWVLRVAGYAALMTDRYPPFRLDMGGTDPAALVVASPGARPDQSSSPGVAAGSEALAPGAPAESARPAAASRWSAGPVIGVVVGSIAALLSLGLLAGGAAALWADQVARGSDGYLTSPAEQFATTEHALVSERIQLAADLPTPPDRWLGTVRFRATSTGTSRSVFVGIAPAKAAGSYLAGAGYATVSRLGPGIVRYVEHDGSTPQPPAAQSFWVESEAGTGTQTLTWKPQRGSWTVVVMNADASSGVVVRADVGATVPSLGWVCVALLVSGFVLVLVAVVLLVLSIEIAYRPRQPNPR